MSTQSIENLLTQSMQQQHAGRMLEARSSLKKILKKIPAHVEALHFVGLTYIQTQEYEKGIASIQRAVAIKPNYMDAQYHLANALYETKRYAEARVAYEKVLSLKPDHWSAYAGLAHVLHLLGHHEDAVNAYQAIVSSKPDFAEAYIGFGAVLAAKLDFHGAISAYSNAIALNPQLPDAHNNLGFALYGLKRFQESIQAFRACIALNPAYLDSYVGLARALKELEQFDAAVEAYKNAFSIRSDVVSAYELASLLEDLTRFEEAIPFYKHVCLINPSFVDGHISLGIGLSQAFRFEEAADVFESVLSLDSGNCDALYNLGNVLSELNRHEQALSFYQRVVAMDPGAYEAHYGLANAFKDLGKLDEAIEYYGSALALAPDLADASLNRGLIYLSQGRFDQGWHDYEQRWHVKVATPLPQTPYPRWLGGEDISNKKIFIQVEQGLGDAIQMIRYVNVLNEYCCKCWVGCHQTLAGLFARSFPSSHIIDTKIYPASCDYHVPLMSLPLALKTFSESAIPADTPYLSASKERIVYWQQKLSASATKVGLVWRGSSTHFNDKYRSAKLDNYMPLITGNPGIQFITMQKDLTEEEKNLLKDCANVNVLDAEVSDFDESAAVVSNLDLFISVDSSPAHLAGALAIPVWVLLPFNAEWRWLQDRRDSPWYPTATLFKQETLGDWNPVIASVDAGLKTLREVAKS